jgi:hypothetical protein
MPYNTKEKQAAAARKYYLENKEKMKRTARLFTKAARLRNKEFIREYKKKHPCVDCGETDFRVLQFDHVNGEKENAVANLSRKASLAKVKEEIVKCEIRCANCHTRRHYRE